MSAYVSNLKLTNVRQFRTESFDFKPGFNLLVGENGSGKSTILKALQAALGGTNPHRGHLFTDSDISLNETTLAVSCELLDEDDELVETATYYRSLGEQARRRGVNKTPTTIFFSSTEAVSTSFKERKARRFGKFSNQGPRDLENWLYHSDSNEARPHIRSGKVNFGHSTIVRNFVLRTLKLLSPKFTDFQWSFEPYDCVLKAEKAIDKEADLTTGEIRKLESVLLRRFMEFSYLFRYIDMPTITLNSGGHILEMDGPSDEQHKLFQKLNAIIGDELGSSRGRPYVVTIRLNPKIRILTSEQQNFLLSQLSDGEQRIFSIIVDIARQLSIDNASETSLTDGNAVILIDEIDCHLHPKWQRIIVDALQETFPRCQIIASTHSPFIIQATPHYQLTHLDHELIGEYSDRGIGEVVAKVLGIRNPDVSDRYLEMLTAAKVYLKALDSVDQSDPSSVELLRNRLDDLSSKYARNPAYQAFLEMRRDAILGSED